MNVIYNLENETYTKKDLEYIFHSKDNREMTDALFQKAYQIKKENVGTNVYLRALIEFSNVCQKNCNYCGIRADSGAKRYTMKEEDVLSAVDFASKERLGSIVIQSGEVQSETHSKKITELLKKIKSKYPNIGITLSLGEQDEETYRQWFEAGAKRYLLRIETTNKNLFKQIHPQGSDDYEARLTALKALKTAGFHAGTGIMLGLPNQRIEDIVNDIIFMRDFDVDMIGLGPYIPHKDTPMYQYKDIIPPEKDRVIYTLLIIAVMRIIMKDINIAATTALETLDPNGKKKALLAGANIIMPNVTNDDYRNSYSLYEGKTKHPTYKNALLSIEKMAESIGEKIGYDMQGDSNHYIKRGGSRYNI